MKKLAVFDLDGTLNKTDLYAVPAHQKAMAEFGFPIKSAKEIISTFGERNVDVRELLTGTDDEDACYKYFHAVSKYEAEFIVDNHGEYDGVTAALKQLKADGYLTAVCSNASSRYITMVLNHLDLLQYIDYIQPLCEGLIKDETLALLLKSVSPDRAVMAGDRKFDKAAAYANGLPFIGCLYGFGGIKSFEVEDAEAAINSANEINAAVLRLIG